MIRFRLLFPVMAALTLFALLAPLVLGMASGILTYHGKCYGFTDGSWPCTWREYISDQVFWSSLLDIPMAIYIIPGWLVAIGLLLGRRLIAHANAVPLALVLLIPAGSSLGGTWLFFIVPVLIRLLY